MWGNVPNFDLTNPDRPLPACLNRLKRSFLILAPPVAADIKALREMEARLESERMAATALRAQVGPAAGLGQFGPVPLGEEALGRVKAGPPGPPGPRPEG